jgi:hypothetical protein
MSMFDKRYRGFRVVELICFFTLVALMLTVYLAKTFAGGERAEISKLEREIADESSRVRLLKAEVSFLEQPDRIGALAAYIGLQPIKADHEITETLLIEAAAKRIKPAPPPPPVAAVDDPAPDGAADDAPVSPAPAEGPR